MADKSRHFVMFEMKGRRGDAIAVTVARQIRAFRETSAMMKTLTSDICLVFIRTRWSVNSYSKLTEKS